MRTFFHDVQYSVRILLNSPGFAVVAILTLAIGIGANTVIFSMARSLMFPAMPYKGADEIVAFHEEHRKTGGFGSSIPDYLDWKVQNTVFLTMAAVSYGWSTISGGAEPEDVDTAFVSENFFSLMGVPPAIGRLFRTEEYHPGAERVMILTYSFWQRQFAGRSSVLGRQLTLSGESYTVVGVMPQGFDDPFFTKAFLPLGARTDSIPSDRANRRAGVFARLRPGATLEEARREMAVIADRLSKAYPTTNKDIDVFVQSWRETMTSRFRLMISLLLSAVACVLLIGCINVANLLMARATSRQKEIAIRLALGARRFRLLRQLLTESLVLSALGGALGVLLAYWSIPLLNGLYTFQHPFRVDSRVLVATSALVGITALLFGSIPAFLLVRLGMGEVLKDKMAQSGNVRSHRFRGALVVGELALSLVLLYGAALLIRSFIRYESLDKGFNPRNVLNVTVNLYKTRYPGGQQVVDFSRNLLAKFERLPSARYFAAATPINLKPGPGGWGVTKFGALPEAAVEAPPIDPLAVSSEYFRVMEIPLLRGHSFTLLDSERGSAIVILDERLAQQLWPGEDPIGQNLKLETESSDVPWLTVVGISKRARGHSFPGVADESMGLYVPMGLIRLGDGALARLGGNRDGRFTSLRFFVRTAGEPSKLASSVRTAVLAVDNQQPVFSVQTMEEKLYREGSPRRSMATLVCLFASAALLLATVGTYGVMAYAVSERTAEIGIRMALGAQRGDVLRLVLRQGFNLLLIGLALGAGGALAFAGMLQSQMFGISANDPATLVAVSLLLAGIALLASYIPARRASSVDPMAALRCE